MAMIKCPECGNQVSDRAKVCIHCGCPIEELAPSGIVKIKASVLKSPAGINGRQKVSIFSGYEGSYKTLWEGESGEVAELHFDGPDNITVKYHGSLMHYGGECSGTIDPAKSKKYNISARQGFMSTKLVLQQVDVFDAD